MANTPRQYEHLGRLSPQQEAALNRVAVLDTAERSIFQQEALLPPVEAVTPVITAAEQIVANASETEPLSASQDPEVNAGFGADQSVMSAEQRADAARVRVLAEAAQQPLGGPANV
jgi:hypothetical protein